MAKRTFSELRKRIDGSDQFMRHGHQILKTRNKSRQNNIPKAIANPELFQALLLRSHPYLRTNATHRARAARWVRVAHLYWMMKMTVGQVAEEMSMSYKMTDRLIERLCLVSKGVRADRSGRLRENRGIETSLGRPNRGPEDECNRIESPQVSRTEENSVGRSKGVDSEERREITAKE